jgi:hypothetical protein
LLIAHAFEPHEKNDFALVLGNLSQRALQFAQLTRPGRIGRRDQALRTFVQLDGRVIAHEAPDLVYVLIMHNREEPGAQIAARLPQVFFLNSASECVLNEIVGVNRVPGQGAGVASQPRDFLLETMMEVAHILFFPSNVAAKNK